MPLWDMYCPTCDTTTEVFFRSSDDKNNYTCKTCGTITESKASSGGFVVKGFNYKNGYSKN